MQHWSTIKINNFDGPLDLLLTMIQSKKLRIEDIDLINITNQYLAYLKNQQVMDLEIASEYLAMAAQLVEMKSWAILPKPQIEVLPETYQEFFNRLEDYDNIRKQAKYLSKRYHYYASLKSKMISYQFFQKHSLPILKPLKISPLELKEIFLKVLSNQKEDDDYSDDNLWMEDLAPVNYVTSQIISPQVMNNLVLDLLETNKQKIWKWEEIEANINPDHNLKNLIALFLVLLDLVHYKIISIHQIDGSLLVQFTLDAIKNSDFRERVNKKFDENA